MDTDLLVEAVGYLASLLIVVSITQTSILRLRVIGLAGSLVFLGYAIVIAAYPIAIVNVIAAGIHLWYLRQLVQRGGEVFRILHVAPDSEYLRRFLEFYDDEIRGRFQPEFVHDPTRPQVAAFVLRDMVPAGLLIGEPCEDETFQVRLDFVIPQYRDFKIGHYVYAPDSALWAGLAPRAIWAEPTTPDHVRYLARMGFRPCPDLPGRMEIRLDPDPGDPTGGF